MKISIIGAGSSYTPELFEKIAEIKERFPVKTISLMDIDKSRLDAVTSFCRRYARRLKLEVKIESTINLDEAVYGSDFVNTQIRVGGNQGRLRDEKISLDEGFIGQETTGPAGFMKALRTIPAMLRIAESIKKNAPDSWLINYTNPTGIISQALHDNTDIKCAALCAGGIRTTWNTADALGVDSKDVQYDIFGLNHLNYSYNIKVKGRPITHEEFLKVAARVSEVSVELAEKIGAVPSGYLQYYYHRLKKIDEFKNALIWHIDHRPCIAVIADCVHCPDCHCGITASAAFLQRRRFIIISFVLKIGKNFFFKFQHQFASCLWSVF